MEQKTVTELVADDKECLRVSADVGFAKLDAVFVEAGLEKASVAVNCEFDVHGGWFFFALATSGHAGKTGDNGLDLESLT